MSARFGFGENFIEVTDFCFYRNEAERGNPYNTTFNVVDQSCAFGGIAPCEYDIHKFKIFVDDLHRLYNFEIDKAMLEDQCYGSKILFEIDRAGHIEVSGKIYGVCMIHTLEFCFDGDQTLLIPFLGGLDEQLRKIGNI